jgi:NADH:ubiquinone oxidoreductase subunit 2 (subunit N)
LIADYQLSAFFLLIVPQSLGMAIWALALSVLKLREKSLDFKERQGDIQRYPIIISGIVFANFSAMGLPLLAGFPPVYALWDGLGATKFIATPWVALGIAGSFIGAIRTLAVMVMTPEEEPWQLQGSPIQNIQIGLGIFLLLILGLFPQLIYPLLVKLPLAYTHLHG